jgi:hypothetical protein
MTPSDRFTEQQSALAEMTAANSDRVTAVLISAIVESELTALLITQLRTESRTVTEMFGVKGLLATFQAKADLAYALSLINAEVFQCLRGIAAVRNLFAHTLSLSFNEPSKRMIDALAFLKLHETRTHYAKDFNPDWRIEPIKDNRSKFQTNAVICYFLLSDEEAKRNELKFKSKAQAIAEALLETDNIATNTSRTADSDSTNV